MFLPLQSADGPRNGAEGRGRDITGCCPNDVDRLGCVKGADLPEVISFKEVFGVQSAAQHEHVGHAVDHQIPQAFAQVQVVQVAACCTLLEIFQIVGQVVSPRIDAGADDGLRQIFPGVQNPKGILKGFDDRWVLRFLDLPEGNRADAAFIPAFFGIGEVKVMLQMDSVALLVKDRDAFASRLHPPSKAPVPALRGEHRGHIGALGMDQELLIEGQTKVGAGGF